jgi:hypothetical protein
MKIGDIAILDNLPNQKQGQPAMPDDVRKAQNTRKKG